MRAKMSVKENQEYKSPLRKLVKFFEQSRNQWKEKYQSAKKTIKRLLNRVRYLETSKEQWKQKARQLEKELKELSGFTESLQEELKKKNDSKKIETKISRFEVIPFHHQYSIGHIMLYLSFVLSSSSSLRGGHRCLETVMEFFQLSLPVPSWYTARLWAAKFRVLQIDTSQRIGNRLDLDSRSYYSIRKRKMFSYFRYPYV